jgi:septal ring factor EnvC (AmiA/AmiB activator)
MKEFIKSLSGCIPYRIWAFGISFFVVCINFKSGFAQSEKDLLQKKSTLQQKQKELQKEITTTNVLLRETQRSQKKSLVQLNLIAKKIDIREELVTNINTQITGLEHEISSNSLIVSSLEADVKALKEEYAQMIFYASKNRSNYDRLMFLFASKDFNQAYKRLKYLQQYSDYRKKQAKIIVQVQGDLTEKIKNLEKKKKDKTLLVVEKEREKLELVMDKKEKEGILTELHFKEREIRDELNKKKQEAEKLQAAIKDVIEKAMEIARLEAIKKAEIEARRLAAEKLKNKDVKNPVKEATPEPAPVERSGFSLTPAEVELSNSFEANKNKLPWPTATGIIESGYGEHQHPDLTHVKTFNNGVDIATDRNAMARAVFDGVVTGVVTIPGANKAIILRHGEYLSVYANLVSVNVKVGDKVSVKQTIGSIFTDPDENKTILHLEIWKGKTQMNPSGWLKD